MKRGALLVILALFGCNRQPAVPTITPTVNPQTDAYSPQQDSINWLQNRTGQMENDIEEVMRADRQWAYLTPQDHGFTGISSDVGTLTIALKDVSPYADGSRIRLEIGNPTLATVSHMTGHIDYGNYGAGGQTVQRTAEHEFSDPIPPGYRRTFLVDLAGIPPSHLEFVHIHDLRVGTMSLATYGARQPDAAP